MVTNRVTISRVPTQLHAMVVDDDPQVCGLVAEILRGDGWNVAEASNEKDCLDLIPAQNWNLVICDVMLGESDGYSILKQFSTDLSSARFVLMTGQGSAAGALDATAIGAYDYILKPFNVGDILGIAHSVRDQIEQRSRKKKSPRPQPLGYVSEIPLVGQSPKFVTCLKMVGRVAPTDLPVLVVGESGTGKEVVARAVHLKSKRASEPFIAVNCGAIPGELIESELFGHSRGSFTGADRERVGMWEEANGGTIFLDEITETSPLFQVKLLRALQEGEIRRVGSNRSQKVNVRVIAATNRNIEEEVEAGRFRQDLMYRLNAVTISLPSLRERREDIRALVRHFAAKAGGSKAVEDSFSEPALEMLEGYDWPGNVRELENAVLHAISLSDDIIYPEHLPARIQQYRRVGSAIDHATDAPLAKDQTWPTLAEMQEQYANRILEFTDGNKQAASRILNIDRKTLTRIASRSENGDHK